MRKWIIVGALALVAGVCLLLATSRLDKLNKEVKRYKANTEALLGEVETYRTRDSLSAARVQSLELSVREFERFRAEDAALIKSLQTKNRDLAAVNKSQTETILDLQAVPRDTVIVVRDSVVVPAVSVRCGDAWYDFHGLLADDYFTGELHNRDTLVIAETVRYARFLGFLWKTKRVKDRRVDCVSKNPHTEVLGVEHVVVER